MNAAASLLARGIGLDGAALAVSATPRPRVKIAVVGLNFGNHIIDELLERPARDFLELTVLCDKDRHRLAAGGRKVDAVCHDDLRGVLADPNVEAVGLFTGPAGRAKLMREILRSGKDILTTKPLELDPDEALEVLLEAKALGRVIHCNSPGPVPTEEIQLIKSWAGKYHLGQPVGGRADVWVSYRETADGSWYDDQTSCPAAPIYRLGIYLINDLVRLWGKVKQVQVMHSRIFTRRPTADNAQVALLFANGAIANIYASFCVNDGDHYRNSMTLNYENGTIYRNAGPAWQLDPGIKSRLALVQSEAGERKITAEKVSAASSGEYLWEHFARAVRKEGVDDQLQPEDMVQGIRVMKAISESERQGKPVDI